MKAFLGMGLLGSSFTKALLKKGEEVHVWNRTAQKAKALEADGAKAFDNAADAVKGATSIHLTLKDDDAVNEVLEQASKGFDAGIVIIDHTTTSATGAAERTEKWKAKGYTYVHAPVFMGPQNALESTGTMLVSGDPAIIDKIEPELAKMTGKVLRLGTENNKAAGYKLMGNMFLMTITAGVSDVLALATSMGLKPQDVETLFTSWNAYGTVPARIKKISEGTFEHPSWELNMARKDARLMMEQAKRAEKKLMIIPAIADEMDNWIAKGHGQEDWTVIGKESVK